jgi:hypothetical protein
LSLSSQKYEFGIRDPEKTYSGYRIQGSKRHRIPDPDPQTLLLTFGNLKCVEHLCVELLQSLVTGRLAGPHQGEETARDVATTAALIRYRGFLTRVQELNRKRNELKRFTKTKNIKVCFMTLVPNFAAQGRFARKNEFRQNAKTVN